MTEKWLSSAAALESLRVQPQTLYAYVSRGKVGVQPDPADPRRSQYRAADIARLVTRRARGRSVDAIAGSAIAMGEPIIATTISTIAHGRLYYRGRDAIDLATTATLEDAAALLWNAGAMPILSWRPAKATARTTGRRCAYAVLAEAAASGNPTFGRAPRVLHDEAAILVGQMAAAFGAASGPAPVHERLAAAWGKGAAASELLRRALVLLADQELTSSAFAARVTASTGAPLGACVLTGFATLSGPLHGDATVLVRSLLEEVERSGSERTIARHLASGLPVPGFGHPLYPDGDPRAAALLGAFDPPGHVKRIIDDVLAATGLHPAIEVALAALSAHLDLPVDAPFALFAIGRSVGWLAHSLEQAPQGVMIRPRARYVGPPVGTGAAA